MERKLASIRRIASVKPIDGADKIELIMVDGWQLVTQKSNNFAPGDLVVYFEIDSFLPIKPEFEFLRKGCYKNTSNLGEGFRIKTIKLRGQVSQGLALPIAELMKDYQYWIGVDKANGWENSGISVRHREGEDLTEFLGVKKYEAPIPAQLAGKIKGNFPGFICKTDSERFQNLIEDIKNDYFNEEFEITQKLDGSSMTVYSYEDKSGVCSRNLDIIEDETNSFWIVANRDRLLDATRYLESVYGTGIAIQGELIGPGVQKNREGQNKLEFYLFNIWNVFSQKYFSHKDRIIALSLINNNLGIKINHVPILGIKSIKEVVSADNLVYDFLSFAEGKTLDGLKQREGVVFKHTKSDFNFKVINNKYLLETEN